MKQNDDDETEAVPLREERSDPRWEKVEEQIKDEILFRKVAKPDAPRAGQIMRFM